MPKYASSDSASFFGSYVSLQPRPLHRFLRYVKWRLFVQEYAFWGLGDKILYLDPIFPKTKLLGQFSTGYEKIQLKNALTMGMLTYP